MQSGIIEIRNTIIAGRGIKVAAETPVVSQGALSLIDVVYESGTTPFLTLDGTNSVMNGINLDRVIIADPINVASVIRSIKGENIHNVYIRNYTFTEPLVDGDQLGSLFLEGMQLNTTTHGWSLGSQKSNYSLIRGDTFHGKWSGRGFNNPFNLVPYPPLAVNQDVDTWSALTGSVKVSTGIMAPDGTSTAAKLTSSFGVQGRGILNKTLNVNAGDWFIVGGWIRAEAANKEPYTLGIFGSINRDFKFSNNSNTVSPFFTDSALEIGASWVPVVNIYIR